VAPVVIAARMMVMVPSVRMPVVATPMMMPPMAVPGPIVTNPAQAVMGPDHAAETPRPIIVDRRVAVIIGAGVTVKKRAIDPRPEVAMMMPIEPRGPIGAVPGKDRRAMKTAAMTEYWTMPETAGKSGT
jgi:hypothetical protein